MSAPTALVVGGTGPTGPHLVQGLLERGFTTSVFHTGRHEVAGDDALARAEHIHGSPFDREAIDEALGTRAFDLVIATYGRTRLIAEAMHTRCGQFVAVGGMPIYRGFMDPSVARPTGLAIPTRETAAREGAEAGRAGAYPVGAMRRTEDTIFALHDGGAFRATVCRYPILYGPRDPAPREWSVVRRVLDRREWIIVPNEGLNIYTRCGARNAAEFVLLVVDQPEVSAGQAYNCADEIQLSLRQWVEVLADAMDVQLELRSLPGEIPNPGWAMLTGVNDLTPHGLLDISKARAELGYRDALAPADGLQQCVEWCVANRSALESQVFLDTFDYAAEDHLVATYERALRDVRDAARPYEQMTLPTNVQTAKSHAANPSGDPSP